MPGLAGSAPMYDFFISHASSDAKNAQDLNTSLERLGKRCFLAPYSIDPGVLFPDQLETAIEQSAVLVVLVSSATRRSSWVKEEMVHAAERKMLIVPVVLTTWRDAPFGLWIRQGICWNTPDQVAAELFGLRLGTQRIPRALIVRWVIGNVLALAVIVVIILRLFPCSSCDPLSVFPGLGCVEYVRNKAFGALRYELLPCDSACMHGLKTFLRVESTLFAGGYGVVLLKKSAGTVDLSGSTVIVRVRLRTGTTKFEAALQDDKDNIAFFHCNARSLGESHEFVLDFPPDLLESAGCMFRSDSVRQFSIGYSNGSGSGVGDHKMDVLGISVVSLPLGLGNFVPCRLVCPKSQRALGAANDRRPARAG